MRLKCLDRNLVVIQTNYLLTDKTLHIYCDVFDDMFLASSNNKGFYPTNNVDLKHETAKK